MCDGNTCSVYMNRMISYWFGHLEMEMIEICILQCKAFFFTFYVKNNKIEYFRAILLNA